MKPRPPTIRSRKLLTLAAVLFATGSVIWSGVSLWHWFGDQWPSVVPWAGRGRRERPPEPPDGPAPTPTRALAAFSNRRSTDGLTNAARLFSGTDVWTLHLRFTPEQWAAIEPHQIEAMNQPFFNSRFELRNPAARRNGLAGVRGLEFEWVHAAVEFEDRTFADVAVRYKGNGTYLRAQHGEKRPFKVDLHKFGKGNDVAGRTTLNLANLAVDDSCIHDALGYELFRAAGVPAPRTAYARLWTTIGTAAPAYRGLYELVENVDEDFANERFGTRKGAIFKPVTHELFSDLGDDWSAYEGIYDPKSKLTPAQSQRVIEFARLLTHADDATFAARAGEFIELDEFARFLAGMVLLSSYDGFLNNGQNFYLWLSPDTGRFQFIPWDLDNAWGKFGFAGPLPDQARASISHPWMGHHRLLERLLAVPDFQARYRRALQEMLTTVFTPGNLLARVDDLAARLRPVVAEESPRKAARFEQAVTATSLDPAAHDRAGSGRNRPPHPLKWFITERARSVGEQLAGTGEGVLLSR
ncbi:MAG TPA: CotH kinase family protein [Candidatus Limnocylindria bacterium]|nr:CotH kinase family protein [Candidatus Limnocylindria bacterium]